MNQGQNDTVSCYCQLIVGISADVVVSITKIAVSLAVQENRNAWNHFPTCLTFFQTDVSTFLKDTIYFIITILRYPMLPPNATQTDVQGDR